MSDNRVPDLFEYQSTAIPARRKTRNRLCGTRKSRGEGGWFESVKEIEDPTVTRANISIKRWCCVLFTR